MLECKSVRVWECESVRARECESERVTFEHRHENKTCSACREWLNERMRECEIAREWECESVKVREWFLSIDMITKVIQHVESEWMREWKSERVREWESVREIWFPAFVWRSDIFIITVVWSSLGHPLGSTQKVPCRRQCLTGGPFIHCKLAKWEQPKGALQAKVPYRGGALQGHDHCTNTIAIN